MLIQYFREICLSLRSSAQETVKKIIHIDADCFYASVEMRENPALHNEAIAVGGPPEKRGVIATCNYEARKFGVRSAMSSAIAKKLCPSLQILAPRIQLYKAYSSQMRDIFYEYTDLIEPLSLDEAYLDVTESATLYGSATFIAREIRERVCEKLGITVSAGVAPVKFLAKIASDWRKPDGLFVIKPEDVDAFVKRLDLRSLPGVGPVTADKLASKGFYTCRDVQEAGVEALISAFGSHSQRLFNMACGIDNRPVDTRHDRKSMSVEKTYASDVVDLNNIYGFLEDLIAELNDRYAKLEGEYRIKKRFVKLKFNDFTTTTVEAGLPTEGEGALDQFRRLAGAAWYRRKRPVRLIGLGFRLGPRTSQQLEFDFKE